MIDDDPMVHNLFSIVRTLHHDITPDVGLLFYEGVQDPILLQAEVGNTGSRRPLIRS